MFKKIEVFEYDKCYYVEIEETKEEIEFWLCKNGVGVKMFMFGITEKELTKSGFNTKQIINHNIEDYIKQYEEEFQRD